MELSMEIIITILLAVLGFIFGALWGHHREIANRVTYTDCNQKRTQCPCVKDVEELKRRLVK